MHERKSRILGSPCVAADNAYMHCDLLRIHYDCAARAPHAPDVTVLLLKIPICCLRSADHHDRLAGVQAINQLIDAQVRQAT